MLGPHCPKFVCDPTPALCRGQVFRGGVLHMVAVRKLPHQDQSKDQSMPTTGSGDLTAISIRWVTNTCGSRTLMTCTWKGPASMPPDWGARPLEGANFQGAGGGDVPGVSDSTDSSGSWMQVPIQLTCQLSRITALLMSPGTDAMQIITWASQQRRHCCDSMHIAWSICTGA